jgi:hypothetical protein
MAWSDRVLALESLMMLAAARLFIKTTKAKNLVSRIGGKPVRGSDADLWPGAEIPDGAASRVGVMVERIARATWWRSMCLEKALAGKWMLHRRGIESTMYVGVAKHNGELLAHAWLVGEGQTVTGGSRIVYAPMAAFGENAAVTGQSRRPGRQP